MNKILFKPKFDEKKFANVVTGDETWVHYFEPVSNKIWTTSTSNFAKGTLRKVLYASSFDIVIQVPVKQEKSVTKNTKILILPIMTNNLLLYLSVLKNGI